MKPVSSVLFFRLKLVSVGVVVAVWVKCVSVNVGSNQVNLKEYEEYVIRISGYEWLGWRMNWNSCG